MRPNRGQHAPRGRAFVDLWIVILIIAGAGALGGLANALATDNTFPLPQRVLNKAGTATVAWQAGALGNMFTAAIAALVSWGLYGPSSAYFIVGSAPAGSPTTPVTLTIYAAASALLIGFGGARWLTNEVDKRLLK